MPKNAKAQLDALMRSELERAEDRLLAHVGKRAETLANQLVRQAWNAEVAEMAVAIVRERIETSGLRQRIVEALAERLTLELIANAIGSILQDRKKEDHYTSHSFYRDVENAVWGVLHEEARSMAPDDDV